MPPDFQFSQSSLQDYVTCPRRFKLRYVTELRWPAVEAEPVQEAERLANLGQDFHQLVHQSFQFAELPDAPTAQEMLRIAASQNDDLLVWWDSFQQHRPSFLEQATLYPEITFSTPLSVKLSEPTLPPLHGAEEPAFEEIEGRTVKGYRLVARFDLLAVTPDGTFWIIDWKTSQRKPRRERLAQKLQTQVYPLILAEAGAAFNQGQPIEPDAIQMMYWYPAAPAQPEIFRYSPQVLAGYESYLSRLVDQISDAVARDNFPMTDDLRPCQHCVYRSLCNRGDKAGPILAEEDDPAEIDLKIDLNSLEWNQIAEIQF